MSSFAESGYLSTEIDKCIKEIRNRYSEWLDLIESINRFGQELQYRLKVDVTDPQSLVCATLYARTLSTFQAAVLLSERGIAPQAQMLLRCMLESIFSLVAISKHKDMARQFIAADAVNRLKMFNKVKTWKSEGLRELTRQRDTGVTKQEIEQDIEETDAKNISVEQMAIKAGLHDWYLTAYVIFSGSVHTSVRDLESHLAVDEASNTVSIVNEPTIAELDKLLLTAAEGMLLVLQAVEKVFSVDTSQFVNNQYAELGRLHKTIED
jgi:hypothetical protein